MKFNKSKLKLIDWRVMLGRQHHRLPTVRFVQMMSWDRMFDVHICPTVERYIGGTIYDEQLKKKCKQFRGTLIKLIYSSGSTRESRLTVECLQLLDDIEKRSAELSEYQ